MQAFVKNWWLLALCGVLDAACCVMNFITKNPDGGFALRSSVHQSTVREMGELLLAAGVCTMAAALWRSRNARGSVLLLNGLASGVLGGILAFLRGPLTFRTIALLVVAMAVSVGMYELTGAVNLRRRAEQGILLALGMISVAFAGAFLAFALHGLRLDPRSPMESLVWLGAYFGFSAVCMLLMAFRWREQDGLASGNWGVQGAV
jgi:uncharacterized membrane protein HdeD (DUF308 family)